MINVIIMKFFETALQLAYKIKNREIINFLIKTQ